MALESEKSKFNHESKYMTHHKIGSIIDISVCKTERKIEIYISHQMPGTLRVLSHLPSKNL